MTLQNAISDGILRCLCLRDFLSGLCLDGRGSFRTIGYDFRTIYQVCAALQ